MTLSKTLLFTFLMVQSMVSGSHSLGECAPVEESCSVDQECCSGWCRGGTCAPNEPPCPPDMSTDCQRRLGGIVLDGCLFHKPDCQPGFHCVHNTCVPDVRRLGSNGHCKSDDDCWQFPYVTCVNRRCTVPTVRRLGKECDSDDDCSGFPCIHHRCRILGSDDGALEHHFSWTRRGCMSDSDCDHFPGSQCRHNVCTAKPARRLERCDSNADCPGRVCQGHVCQTLNTGRRRLATTGSARTDSCLDFICPPGFHCDLWDHTCVPNERRLGGIVLDGCLFHKPDCQPGFHCVHNTCVPDERRLGGARPVGCLFDRLFCPPGFHCVHNVCVRHGRRLETGARLQALEEGDVSVPNEPLRLRRGCQQPSSCGQGGPRCCPGSMCQFVNVFGRKVGRCVGHRNLGHSNSNSGMPAFVKDIVANFEDLEGDSDDNNLDENSDDDCNDSDDSTSDDSQ